MATNNASQPLGYLISSPTEFSLILSWLRGFFPYSLKYHHFLSTIAESSEARALQGEKKNSDDENPSNYRIFPSVYVNSWDFSRLSTIVFIYGQENHIRWENQAKFLRANREKGISQAVPIDLAIEQDNFLEKSSSSDSTIPILDYREYDISFFTTEEIPSFPQEAIKAENSSNSLVSSELLNQFSQLTAVRLLESLVDFARPFYFACLEGAGEEIPRYFLWKRRERENSRKIPGKQEIFYRINEIPCYQYGFPDNVEDFPLEYQKTLTINENQPFSRENPYSFLVGEEKYWIFPLPKEDPETVEMILKHWAYSSAETRGRIEELCRQTLCMGIYRSSEGNAANLIGWALIQSYGAIGMLEILESYRGRGLARTFMLAMGKQFREYGKLVEERRKNINFPPSADGAAIAAAEKAANLSSYPSSREFSIPVGHFSLHSPHCYITIHNNSSMKVFESLKFLRTNRMSWIRWYVEDKKQEQGGK